jgi:glycosyltransferase involved in cell wall biosynthesis
LPKVTVVIPTIGRPQLTRAIKSVNAQDYNDIEIIVVGPSGEAVLPDGISHLSKEKSINVCEARNIGTSAGTGEFIAYLDDDDFWKPNKISAQMRVLNNSSSKTIVGCRYETLGVLGNKVQPRELIISGQSMMNYLFGKVNVRPGLRYFQTSGIILSTHNALEIGWDKSIPKHNDWDFLLRAQELGFKFVQLEESLVIVDQRDQQSISRSCNSEISKPFYLRYVNSMNRTEESTFLVSAVFQNVLNSKNSKNALKLGTRIFLLNPTPKTLLLIILRLSNIRNILKFFGRKL